MVNVFQLLGLIVLKVLCPKIYDDDIVSVIFLHTVTYANYTILLHSQNRYVYPYVLASFDEHCFILVLLIMTKTYTQRQKYVVQTC
jgi:hypothetical protein